MIQPQPGKHIPTEREQAFLDTVEETRYEREIINGLAPFFNEKAPELLETLDAAWVAVRESVEGESNEQEEPSERQ